MRTLDQMIDAAHEHARHVLIGSATNQIQSFFHIQFKNQPDAMVPALWKNEGQKSALIHAVREALKACRQDVVNYFVISEAWVASQDHPARDGDLLPSERETRKEVVLVSAGDHKGGRMKFWEIIRDDKGRVTDLAEVKGLSAQASFGGRMLDLLHDEDDN